MLRTKSARRNFGLAAMLVLSLIGWFVSAKIVRVADAASYTGVAKPMEFYFHYVDAPVDVAGTQSKYVMNTTRLFKFATNQEALTNSFYKPSGLPKLTVYFYLYPNVAGPVTLDGSWQVFLWVNSSAQHPVGFTTRFYEVDIGGAQLWDSGPFSPTVTSSGDPGQIDVPIQNYNLSTTLTHAFTPNSTLKVEAEVNAGSAADIRVWYDSPFYPSKAILPAKDYARPSWVKTYSYDNSESSLFNYNWSDAQRKVIVRANVTDPFGGYDINKVNMTIFDPTGNPVVDNVDMTKISDGQWQINFQHLFEANWSYSSTARLGNYTVKVSVIDNNGYYHYLDVGSYGPFIEWNDRLFSIGVLVYYNPRFQMVDDSDDPLPNAQVFVTWPNGSMDALPRYTGADGLITLQHVLPADYTFTVLWKDTVVKRETVNVNSDGPYTIKTDVYQLTVQVLGNNNVAVQGAYVIVYTQAGVGYGLDTTNVAGQAIFKLPKGTYDIEAHFSAEYWLRVVTTSQALQGVSVNSSMSKTIVLSEFPPQIWTTTAFWLIAALIAVSVLVAVYVVFLSKRASTPRRPALRRRT